MSPAVPVEIRQPSPSELEEALEIPSSPERARWLRHHVRNPAGQRILVGVDEGGGVARAYAGRRLRVRLEGAPAAFTLVSDTFREGASEAFDRAFGQCFGGGEEGQDVVLFGLPDGPAWDVARTELRYDMIRSQLALVAPASSRSGGGGAAAPDVEEVEAFPEAVDELFGRAASASPAIAERTRATLQHRFPPGEGFRIALARRQGALQGYAVFHPEGPPELERTAWVWDWLVPSGTEEDAAPLRSWLRERAAEAGASDLAALFPDSCPDWIAFQRAGFQARPFPRFLVARTFAKRQSMRWLYHNWYYTLADVVD